jgi:hypothetical protein
MGVNTTSGARARDLFMAQPAVPLDALAIPQMTLKELAEHVGEAAATY